MHLDWFSLRNDLKGRWGRPGLQEVPCPRRTMCIRNSDIFVRRRTGAVSCVSLSSPSYSERSSAEYCDAEGGRPRSQSRWRLDGGGRRRLEFREGAGGRRGSHACGDERRRHEGRGKGVHQALSDSARARASSRAYPTHPGNGCHSPHTGRSSRVSLTAAGAVGERTRLGTASRFISRDEVGGGAAAFHRGQEAAKDRTRSKPSPQ
jgi:hypothetical protein